MKNIAINLINLLIYEFKIISVIPDDQKDKLGNFLLKDINSNSYYDLIMLLGNLDFSDQKKIDEKMKENIKKVRNIIVNNKNYFLSKINEIKDKKKIPVRLEFLLELEKALKNLKEKINEMKMKNKNKKLTSLELSKLKKPRINPLNLPKQGPFTKDTKSRGLKKDPFDRKYSKYKFDKNKIDENKNIIFCNLDPLNKKRLIREREKNMQENISDILKINKFLNNLDESINNLEYIIKISNDEIKKKIANKFLTLYNKIVGGILN